MLTRDEIIAQRKEEQDRARREAEEALEKARARSRDREYDPADSSRRPDERRPRGRLAPLYKGSRWNNTKLNFRIPASRRYRPVFIDTKGVTFHFRASQVRAPSPPILTDWCALRLATRMRDEAVRVSGSDATVPRMRDVFHGVSKAAKHASRDAVRASGFDINAKGQLEGAEFANYVERGYGMDAEERAIGDDPALGEAYVTRTLDDGMERAPGGYGDDRSAQERDNDPLLNPEPSTLQVDIDIRRKLLDPGFEEDEEDEARRKAKRRNENQAGMHLLEAMGMHRFLPEGIEKPINIDSLPFAPGPLPVVPKPEAEYTDAHRGLETINGRPVILSNISGDPERRRSYWEAVRRTETRRMPGRLHIESPDIGALSRLMDRPGIPAKLRSYISREIEAMAISRGRGVAYAQHGLSLTPEAAGTIITWLAMQPETRSGAVKLRYDPGQGPIVQRRLVLEMPHEVSPEGRAEILARFVSVFDSMGIMYTAVLHQPDEHNDARNYHAHILYHERPARWMEAYRCWDFEYQTVDEAGNAIFPFRQKKNAFVSWKAPDPKQSFIATMRRIYCRTMNEVLAEEGIAKRYDYRSYKDAGVDAVPGVHLGTRANALESSGIATEKGVRNAIRSWQVYENMLIRQRDEDLRNTVAKIERLRRRAESGHLSRYQIEDANGLIEEIRVDETRLVEVKHSLAMFDMIHERERSRAEKTLRTTSALLQAYEKGVAVREVQKSVDEIRRRRNEAAKHLKTLDAEFAADRPIIEKLERERKELSERINRNMQELTVILARRGDVNYDPMDVIRRRRARESIIATSHMSSDDRLYARARIAPIPAATIANTDMFQPARKEGERQADEMFVVGSSQEISDIVQRRKESLARSEQEIRLANDGRISEQRRATIESIVHKVIDNWMLVVKNPETGTYDIPGLPTDEMRFLAREMKRPEMLERVEGIAVYQATTMTELVDWYEEQVTRGNDRVFLANGLPDPELEPERHAQAKGLGSVPILRMRILMAGEMVRRNGLVSEKEANLIAPDQHIIDSYAHTLAIAVDESLGSGKPEGSPSGDGMVIANGKNEGAGQGQSAGDTKGSELSGGSASNASATNETISGEPAVDETAVSRGDGDRGRMVVIGPTMFRRSPSSGNFMEPADGSKPVFDLASAPAGTDISRPAMFREGEIPDPTSAVNADVAAYLEGLKQNVPADSLDELVERIMKSPEAEHELAILSPAAYLTYDNRRHVIRIHQASAAQDIDPELQRFLDEWDDD